MASDNPLVSFDGVVTAGAGTSTIFPVVEFFLMADETQTLTLFGWSIERPVFRLFFVCGGTELTASKNGPSCCVSSSSVASTMSWLWSSPFSFGDDVCTPGSHALFPCEQEVPPSPALSALCK